MRTGTALAVILLAATCGALPSCRYPRHFTDHDYTCLGFSNASELEEEIQLLRAGAPIHLTLKDSRLEHLPSSAFAHLAVSVLELSNVTVETFTLAEQHPFEGFEDTLTEITFSDDSTLPESWAVLKELHKLRVLAISDMSSVNLTRDFHLLPPTLRVIGVTSSHLGYVDDEWLAPLTNLEVIAVRDTTMSSLKRSMLPRPAPNLWRLMFHNNSLTSVPKDLLEDMPKLIAVDLGDNLIQTFDEESITPIFKQPLYDLIIAGNPLHCDCKLRFLRGHIKNWRLNHCVTPESLRGHHLNWVTDHELGCRNATPPAVPTPPGR
ncbi:hypothetical protein HPB50_007725 [Hyalomma asiaticum]|uniref:Uncharacterized protein n=1 Tax=Hyalomma asiaticum TaxID=266040 RepID=A0ACB7S8I3_HYAAI|nr:hypothetical protein HPB50_007725 [Hyalomma asiaticum]